MASFDDILEEVRAFAAQEGRVAYRTLKRRFELDDEDIEDIKAELIDAKQIARDEGGRVLVWLGSAGAGAPTRPAGIGGAETAADRRLITVMFCDIVGSTELSARFDAEELREIVRRYQEVCAQVIAAHDGHIAQYLGDGLLVYFGYPVALEDEAGLAVRTALDIIEALRTDAMLLSRLGQPLQVRIGIHTGQVVIGEMGGELRAERLALGETPNIAARVQGAARPDEILITAATLRLVDGLFECEQHGPHVLKGITLPIELYTVRGEGAALNRFEVALSTGVLTPFVGRDNELSMFSRHWQTATSGRGQVVLLSGEAGIGKSRLAQAFKERTGESTRHITLRCSPNHQKSAFYPLIQVLRRMCEVQRADDAEALERISNTIAPYRFARADSAPLLAEFLGFDTSGADVQPPVDASDRKRRLFDTLTAWFVEEAETRPVFMIVDDVHWMDPATHEFLAGFLEHVPSMPIMAILAFRSDFLPPWPQRSFLNAMPLGGLDAAEIDAMVADIAGDAALSPALFDYVRARTDGVPLYVEELTRALVENGGIADASNLQEAGIPQTLHDSLEARLDSVPAGKDIAQWGAVIGREFSHALLDKLIDNPNRLRRGLDELLDAELVYRSGAPGNPAYIFKHALVRDTAYESLLNRERRERHALIAETIERDFPDLDEREPELVAYHYAEAAIESRAAEKLYEAALHALEQAAEAIAVGHLEQALELLARLPQSRTRAVNELKITLLLGPLINATRGAGAAECRQIYERALKLCEAAGDRRSRFPAYFGLRQYYLARADLGTAHEIGQALFRAAEGASNPEYLLEANVALSSSSFLRGDIAASGKYADAALAIYSTGSYRRHAYTYGADPGVVCRVRAAQVALMRVAADSAAQQLAEACAASEELGHPASGAFAHGHAAELNAWLEDHAGAVTEATRVGEIAGHSGFPYWRAWSEVMIGRAQACGERDPGGVERIRGGIEDFDEATGSTSLRQHLYYPHFLIALAEACGHVGEVEQGLAYLPEAISLTERAGMRLAHAIAYTIRAELMGQMKLTAEADRSFAKAHALASECGAGWFALRAATSRYTLDAGNESARDMLLACTNELDGTAGGPWVSRARDALGGAVS